jgi:steroid 5-alpha reductase family enzyme
MTFFELLALSALVILIYMMLVWMASVVLKNASIVDTFWGPGFVLSQ